jgi:hypothetical protein
LIVGRGLAVVAVASSMILPGLSTGLEDERCGEHQEGLSLERYKPSVASFHLTLLRFLILPLRHFLTRSNAGLRSSSHATISCNPSFRPVQHPSIFCLISLQMKKTDIAWEGCCLKTSSIRRERLGSCCAAKSPMLELVQFCIAEIVKRSLSLSCFHSVRSNFWTILRTKSFFDFLAC